MRAVNKILLGAVLVTLSSFSAKADTWITPTGSMNGTENVDASAAFTFGAGTITINLTNLLTANQVHAIGGNISDISFTISNSFTGTVNDTDRSYTGKLINVDGNGNVTACTGACIVYTGWDFSNSGSTFLLETLGSATGNNETIVGGTTSTTAYTGANSSIENGHGNPLIQGSAVFTLDVAGVTATNTSITGVVFSFGTGTGANVTGTDCTSNCTGNGGGSPVPETSSVLLLGTVSALLIPVLRRFRKA